MSDFRETLQRLDPPGCGCTECLTGYSKPLDDATEAELHACFRGALDNATERDLRIADDGTIDTHYRTALRRLDPPDCWCSDCVTGYAKALSDASDKELRACARGELDNGTGRDIRIDDDGLLSVT